VPICPLVLTACVIATNAIAHLGNSLGQLLLLYFAPFNWLPLLNPLVTILTIDEYRRELIGIFKGQQQSQTPIVPFVNV
jgi:hypothetical protein